MNNLQQRQRPGELTEQFFTLHPQKIEPNIKINSTTSDTPSCPDIHRIQSTTMVTMAEGTQNLNPGPQMKLGGKHLVALSPSRSRKMIYNVAEFSKYYEECKEGLSDYGKLANLKKGGNVLKISKGRLGFGEEKDSITPSTDTEKVEAGRKGSFFSNFRQFSGKESLSCSIIEFSAENEQDLGNLEASEEDEDRQKLSCTEFIRYKKPVNQIMVNCTSSKHPHRTHLLNNPHENKSSDKSQYSGYFRQPNVTLVKQSLRKESLGKNCFYSNTCLEVEPPKCFICSKNTQNGQIVVCFEVCEHKFHENCITELGKFPNQYLKEEEDILLCPNCAIPRDFS